MRSCWFSYATTRVALLVLVACGFGESNTRGQSLLVLGDRSGPNQPFVLRYTADGEVDTTYLLEGFGGYRAFALDRSTLPSSIFIASGPLSMVRMNLDGGTLEQVLPGYAPNSIATDPLQERLYFGVSSGAIYSASYDGTDLREVYPVPAGVQNITAMAIDPYDGWLYWAASRDIRRVPLAGGPVELIVGPTSPGVRPYLPYDIALDLVHDRLYWSEWDVIQQGEIPEDTSGRIMRSNLDGSNPQVVVQDVRYDDIPGVPEIGINPKSFAIDAVAGILVAYDDQGGHLVKYCLDGSCYDEDFEGPNLSYDPIDMAVIPAIPEPSTLALAGVGAAMLAAWRVRRRRGA